MSVTHGQILKDIRRRRGYSQQNLANLIASDHAYDLTQATIGKLERGERTMTLSDAVALARVLRCSLDELAGKQPTALEVEFEQLVRDADAFRLMSSLFHRLERGDDTRKTHPEATTWTWSPSFDRKQEVGDDDWDQTRHWRRSPGEELTS